MTGAVADADRFLLSVGADRIPHPGGTLLGHLRRVRLLLADWDADEDVQLAGLCHACYGTDGFDVVLLEHTDGRAALRAIVGGSIEGLVYLYGSCDRAATYPGLGAAQPEFVDRFTGARHLPAAPSVRAFAEITAANELDVVRHNPSLAASHGRDLHRLMERAAQHLSAGARTAWDDWASAAAAHSQPRRD